VTREENCDRKLAYGCERDAGDEAKRRMRNVGVPKLYTYQCPRCKLWHLTKTRQITPEDFDCLN
jgi:hypothetical protein